MSKRRSRGFCDEIKKRKLTNTTKNIFITTEHESTPLNSAESALIAVKEIFPVRELCFRLPAVILVHQIYSFIKNRTVADKDTNLLVEKDVIRLFKLGFKSSTMVAIFTEDFKHFVMDRICPCQAQTNKSEPSEDNKQTNNLKSQPLLTIEKCYSGSKKITDQESKICHQSTVVARFIFEIMPKLQDVSVDKELLQTEYKFSEEDLRTLMNVGLLAVRSVGSYWLSFPSAGEFMKYFSKGRAALMRLVKKCKFSEILQPAVGDTFEQKTNFHVRGIGKETAREDSQIWIKISYLRLNWSRPSSVHRNYFRDPFEDLQQSKVNECVFKRQFPLAYKANY